MYEQVLQNMRRRYDQSERVKEWLPTHPPAYSETDSGYSSERGSVLDPSESNYAPSESDRSRETPPYFKEDRKEDTIMIASTQKIIEAALKETLSSQVRVVVYLVAVAALLYFACSCFSRETAVKHVNVVLQSSSGEEMSAELINRLKKEVEIGIRAEIQAEVDKNQAADSGFFYNVSGFFSCFFGIFYHIIGACYALLVFVIKVLFVIFIPLFLIGLCQEGVKRTNRT